MCGATEPSAGRDRDPLLSRAASLARRGGGALLAGCHLLTDLVFPPRCGLCGGFGSFLCEPCAAALPRADGKRCLTCAAPVSGRRRCRSCAALAEQPLASLNAVFRFDGGARRLIHRLKYERLSALAEPMGRLMAAALPDHGADVIVPVPLHPRRRRERGFNQAALIARAISRGTAAPLDARALVRLRPTPPQVRQGGVAERAANVAGAFACRAPMAGRTVLLIDDVATTGATLRACAATLRAAGAGAVHAAVFARDD